MRAGYANLIVKAGEHNKSEVFYEYDKAIECLSRLYSFAHSPPHDDIEIQTRLERFAKDDFLNFAVHARRLFEISNLFALAKAARVPSCRFVKAGDIVSKKLIRPGETVWKIINAAVHHNTMHIWNADWQIRAWLFPDKDRKFLFLEREYFPPTIVFVSDKTKLLNFDLRAFIKVFNTEVFEPLVEALSEHGVYVELDMREF